MDFDFSNSVVVENLERVPEQFRGLYKENAEKKYALSDSPEVKGAVEALIGLTRALKAERAIKKPSVDLAPLKDFGETPEAIRAKIDELKDQIASSAKIDPKKIKDEMASQFKNDLDAKDSRIGALIGQLNSLLIDAALQNAISAEKGDPELLLPFARSLMKPFESDGKYEVRVVDETGNARYSTTTGNPMTPVELVREMKRNPKFGKLFEATVPEGGGAPARGSARPTPRSTETSREISSIEKIKRGLDAKTR